MGSQQGRQGDLIKPDRGDEKLFEKIMHKIALLFPCDAQAVSNLSKAFQYSSGELSRIINSIRLAAKVVNYKVKSRKSKVVDLLQLAFPES